MILPFIAGDIMNKQVFDDLQPSGGAIYAVRGNNDTLDKTAGWDASRLDKLPDQWRLSLPGGVLCVEHGHRIWDTRNYHRRLRAKYEHLKPRAIVYGHTHKLVCDQSNTPWVLNPVRRAG